MLTISRQEGFQVSIMGNYRTSRMAPEGFRRLSLLLGIIGCIAWTMIQLVAHCEKGRAVEFWDLLVISMPVLLFAPSEIARGFAWVAEGFHKS